jgi:ketosteroid isomerase-like protein
MKRSLLFVVLAAIGISSCGAPDPSPSTVTEAPAPTSTDNAEEALIQLENERSPALVKGDTAFIERVYADDYIVTGANGVVRDKAAVIADMKSGAQTFESMTNDVAKVRVYGDTAVVTGRATQKGQYKGQPSPTPTAFTRVYVRRNGQWQLVANASAATQ